MKTSATKSTQAKRNAVNTSQVSRSRSGLTTETSAPRAAAFVDNRPEAMAQRKMQEVVDHRPQDSRLARIDHSPHQVAQRHQIARLFGLPMQRQEGLEGEARQMTAEAALMQRQPELEEEELLQGKFATGQRQEDLEEDELIQGKFKSVQRQGPEEDELLQGKFAPKVTPTPFKGASGQQEYTTGLPDNLKAGIAHLSGLSMADVNVHYNSSQPAQLQALAYTQGTDIHAGPGQEKHLPHEAWHVVQQKQGRAQPTLQVKGVPINDDKGLEQEADVMGTKALQMRRPDHVATGSVVPTRHGSEVLQRTVTLGGAASDANAILQDAATREGYDAWNSKDALRALQASPHVIDFTWNVAGHYDVTVNANAVAGMPATIALAATAAETHMAGMFVSLAADVTAGRYKITRSSEKKIRGRTAEKDFPTKYSEGKSVADAVAEAIAAMRADGTSRVTHSRLDSQPAGSDVYNFQVQLGGSAGDYRRGKGDTSSTVVIVPVELFQRESAADSARWVQVLQAAHTESFTNTSKLEFEMPD